MKRIVEALTVVFAAMALSLLAGSCSSGGDYCQLSGYAQGGTYSIKFDKKGIKVKIENLFFATNKTYILPQSEQAMADLAEFLLLNPSVTIHITGHTDAVGSDEANQILSEGRANAVRADLIKRGVAPERMTAEGKGEREFVADNDTEEGRQLNRRVEFVITGTDGEDIEQVF